MSSSGGPRRPSTPPSSPGAPRSPRRSSATSAAKAQTSDLSLHVSTSARKRSPINPEAQHQLGTAIRRLRLAQEISQERFAQDVGVHRTFMGLIERGQSNVSLSILLRIAEALNMRVGDLLNLAFPGSVRPSRNRPSSGGRTAI